MKKLLIFLSTIVGAVLLLPVLGNKVTENELKNKIEVLTSYGVEVSKSDTDSSYFRTKKHYEFLLRDADKFVVYINQFSGSQLPPYVNAMLGGVMVGVDIEYSNFPLSEAVQIDIYPLSLSTSMMNDIQASDIKFYKYLKELFQSKGILYHINYNMLSREFDGYMKNISKEHISKDNTKITFKLSNALFDGSGLLIAPDTLNTNIESIFLQVEKEKEIFTLNIKKMLSSAIFESHSTHASSIKLQTFDLRMSGTKADDIILNVNDISINISLNTQGSKAEFYTKSTFGDVKIISNALNLMASNFNYDIALDGIDKDSYEEFRLLVSKTKTQQADDVLQKEILDSMIKILSKGLILSIADFSLDTVILNNRQDLDGFALKAKLTLKEDADFGKKMNSSPLEMAKNIDFELVLKLSKTMYGAITEIVPAAVLIKGYAKEDAKNVVFDVKLNNGQLRVNDKAL
ncbi:YdgA family protein [bacterium]|nr:YdgA family protein [bacterium]MBU1993214.1 YdgA family protein [bacterium]